MAEEKKTVRIAIGEHIAEIDLSRGEEPGCRYFVDGVQVTAEDYALILASLRTDTLAEIAHALHPDNEEGLHYQLSLVKEQLDPLVEDTFGHRLMQKLSVLIEVLPE